MSAILSKNSKTEFVIAIDDEDSDEDNDQNDSSDNAIEEGVSQTLNSILDSIESMPQIDKFEAECVQIDDNSDEEEVIISSFGDQNSRNKEVINRVIRPVDDYVEDIDNMEVNIYSRDDDSDEFEAYEMAYEAEDCMVIDQMTDRQFEQQMESPENDSDDDIVIIDNKVEEKSSPPEATAEDVIDLSDDEEDCVIINDSFSITV